MTTPDIMKLNDPSSFKAIDTQNMLAEIDGLPDQLEHAWELGTKLEIPAWKDIRQIIIAGMGGSAIGADLLSAYAIPHATVPIIVHRDYGLPAWAAGPETLVIASSHSGNTEETLSAFDDAVSRDCRILIVTTGGKLAARAAETSAALWQFQHNGQPRAAVGYSFGLLLAAISRLGLMPDPSAEVEDAVNAMRKQQELLNANVPVAANPAKRTAGQWIGRWVTIIGADFLVPVARRWKGQVNELAKTWAQFDSLPEADHNTLAGVINAKEAVLYTMVVFLRAKANHPRNQLRTELTKKIFMLEALNTDFVSAKGDTPLAQMWTTLHFGDYTSYYLAMAYGADPTPVSAIEGLKAELKNAGS